MNKKKLLIVGVLGVGGYLAYRYLSSTSVAGAVGNTTTVAGLKAYATQIAKQYNIPAGLFRALIQTESAWKPNARSSVGAVGLAQLMPGTARDLGVSNPLDPIQSMTGGAKYLAQQYNTFKSWPLALAAYNAGPGNVTKYKGIPPFAETVAYVAKIMALSVIS